MPTANFNLPIYTTSDTAALDTLLNGQSNAIDAALLANIWSLAGLDAARIALTAPKLREGLRWYSTDTNVSWFYDGTTWQYDNIVTAGAMTPPAGITLGIQRIHRQGRLVTVHVDGSKATDVTAGETIATIPVGFRPVSNILVGLHLAGGYGFVGSWGTIQTDGQIRANGPGAAGIRNFYFVTSYMI